MTDKIVILITAKNVRECGQIARHLLDKRLIACANLVPEVRSLYHWQGKVASEKECWMILKTRRDLFAAIQAEVETLQSYHVPEVIALPIIEGSLNYLNWLEQSLPPLEATPAQRFRPRCPP